MSNLRSIMFAAAVAVFSLPPAAHAVTMVTTDTFNISGTYSIIPQTDPMIGGTLSVELSPMQTVTAADVTLSGPPALTFTDILNQFVVGSDYQINLEDTTNTYELYLRIDTDATLFAGQASTIDGATFLQVISSEQTVGNDFTGNVAISSTPLPATLPLFAGGLGFVGYLAKRRKRSTKLSLAAA